MKIEIKKNGNISKTIIMDIHYKIKNKLNTNELEFGYYITRVYSFLKNFTQVKTVFDFFNETDDIYVDIDKVIIFYNISKNYLNVELIQNQELVCISCYSEIFENNDSEFICENCGLVQNYKITSKENDLQKQTYYSLKSNFLKAINNFQGVGIIIKVEDLDKINYEINRRNISIEILNRDHIYRILKDLKMSKYYDNINVIMNKIIGTPLKDISDKIPKLMELHSKIEYIYGFVKTLRVNSLNVQFKLYKLLQMLDIKCDINELLKTNQKLEEHEKKWEQICEQLNWEVIK